MNEIQIIQQQLATEQQHFAAASRACAAAIGQGTFRAGGEFAAALAQERFGISLDWLMEAAGWQVARFCPKATAVVCGVGNNAGDGLAAARHLQRWGKLKGVFCRMRSLASRRYASCIHSRRLTTPRCSFIAPFGCPVEPDV